MTRRATTVANMREMLLMQAEERGHPIRCALCGGYILPGDSTIRAHTHALGLARSYTHGHARRRLCLQFRRRIARTVAAHATLKRSSQ